MPFKPAVSQFHFRSSFGGRRKFSLFTSSPFLFEYAGSSLINPATTFAYLFESAHQLSGLSWPATIIAYTLGMRSLLFPAHVKQTKAALVAKNLKDDVSSFQTRIQTLRANNQITEAQEELKNMNQFLRKNGCHPFRIIILSLAPVPFFMSTFFALRNMAMQPIESFTQGGWGWFLDLTQSDPLFILPALSCITMLSSFEISRKFNPDMVPKQMVNFLRLLGLVSIPVLSYMPSALCIYFITTNSFTLLQNVMILSPKVRKVLKLPLLNSVSSKQPVSPADSQNFIQKLTSALLKQPATDSSRFIIHGTKPLSLRN